MYSCMYFKYMNVVLVEEPSLSEPPPLPPPSLGRSAEPTPVFHHHTFLR